MIEISNLMTKKQMSEFLSVSPRQLDYLRERNNLPFLKIGGGVRFCREDVLKWLEGQKKNCEQKDAGN